jgi:hypothetical protein
MDGLIKALAAFPVSDLDVARPSLEEAFLAHYQDNNHAVEAAPTEQPEGASHVD